MSSRRALFWASLALTVLYAVRAGFGLVAGLSYSEGRRLTRGGYYEEAIPRLERAMVGGLEPEALWLAGQARIGLWEYRIAAGAEPEEVQELFDDAYRDHARRLARTLGGTS